jgi:hypothetical protein
MKTENEIIKENRIIAHFMNYFYIKDFDTYSIPEQERLKVDSFSYSYEFSDIFKSKELKFHLSYDWLMPVIEKIENLNLDEFGLGEFVSNISNRQGFYCEFRLRNSYETKISDSFGDSKIDAIYNAVIEFINWYNETFK